MLPFLSVKPLGAISAVRGLIIGAKRFRHPLVRACLRVLLLLLLPALLLLLFGCCWLFFGQVEREGANPVFGNRPGRSGLAHKA